MTEAHNAGRRRFVKLCVSAAALVGVNPDALAARVPSAARRYQRAMLVDARGQPIRAHDLKPGETYVFLYPYVSTPCFLMDLGRPTAAHVALKTEDGHPYEWSGGVGPQRSIVAFSAICAHKMSYPARAASFINYRHQPVRFAGRREESVRRAQVIYCCSEKSVYDPLEGARVLGGPARQPLAAVLLELDAGNGALYATGTDGGEMFERFFREFGFRLALDLKAPDIRAEVSGTSEVVPLAEYCQNPILC